jgi:hypothetical protein
VKPFYRSADGAITVYCARWEDVLASGAFDPRKVDLIHADPPYGVACDVKRRTEGQPQPRPRLSKLSGGGRGREYSPIVGDDKPFDPSAVLALARPTVLWGANNYASRLPDSRAWIVWDKTEEMQPNDSADVELAWTNLGGAERCFGHWWRGALRSSEKDERHLHPTQKPIALAAWIFRERAKLKPGALVFVPYMGSGPELAACVAMGLRCIACEIDENYVRAAVGARLHASPSSPLDGLALFAPRPA